MNEKNMEGLKPFTRVPQALDFLFFKFYIALMRHYAKRRRLRGLTADFLNNGAAN